MNNYNNYNNIYNDEYKNEVKSIKDSLTKIFNNIDIIKFNNCKSSKLCFNFIKGQKCKWYEQGKCKFAHSLDELDVSSIFKVLELGMQAYYYIYIEQQEKDKNFSIFNLVNIYKNAELLFRQEHYNLYKSKMQYNELHKYIFKLKKELEFQHEIGSLHLNNHINNLINSDCLGNKIKEEFNKLKELINSTIGCKICYKNIIELNKDEEIQDNNTLKNNYKFINLSFGHSKCEHCHIELINKKTNIYIECPLCRNMNNINNTIPNYELNEQILKIKLIFSKLNNIYNDIINNYKQLNTNNFVIKNKKTGHIMHNKKTGITLIKSLEAPW